MKEKDVDYEKKLPEIIHFLLGMPMDVIESIKEPELEKIVEQFNLDMESTFCEYLGKMREAYHTNRNFFVKGMELLSYLAIEFDKKPYYDVKCNWKERLKEMYRYVFAMILQLNVFEFTILIANNAHLKGYGQVCSPFVDKIKDKTLMDVLADICNAMLQENIGEEEKIRLAELTYFLFVIPFSY